MRTTSIHYSKVFSLGNYENEKIGVDIEVQEGDEIQKVIQTARDFVEYNHKLNGFNSERAQLQHVVNNPDEFTGKAVRDAKQRLSEIEEQINFGTKLLTT